MLAIKIRSRIDKKGNLSLRNLPVKDQESVEIIILVEDQKEKEMNLQLKLNKLMATFGTVTSNAVIPDQQLSRENIYGSEGR
jgi:hypothetical protein